MLLLGKLDNGDRRGWWLKDRVGGEDTESRLQLSDRNRIARSEQCTRWCHSRRGRSARRALVTPLLCSTLWASGFNTRERSTSNQCHIFQLNAYLPAVVFLVYSTCQDSSSIILRSLRVEGQMNDATEFYSQTLSYRRTRQAGVEIKRGTKVSL